MKMLITVALSIALLASAPSYAGNVNDDLSGVKSGEMVCGRGDIRVRNLNDNLRLMIMSVRLYDQTGTEILDIFDTAGFTTDLPTTTQILSPNGSTMVKESELFGAIGGTPHSGGPWQVAIEFKNMKVSNTKATLGLPPKMGGVRVYTDADTVLGYHSFGCSFRSAVR